MSTSLLTAYDIAALRHHPNAKLVVRFDPSTSSVSIIDTIHIEEDARRGYAAFRVDYSRIIGPVLAVRSTSSALKIVTTRLRAGFAASGVSLAAERSGMDGDTVFDLVLTAGL